MLAAILGPSLAGLFGGIAQGKQAGAGLAEDKRRYELERGDREARSRMTGPMRDKLMYMLMQRMGLPQRVAKPPDWSGQSQLGGYDEDAYNKLMQAYQPGMGGGL